MPLVIGAEEEGGLGEKVCHLSWSFINGPLFVLIDGLPLFSFEIVFARGCGTRLKKIRTLGKGRNCLLKT